MADLNSKEPIMDPLQVVALHHVMGVPADQRQRQQALETMFAEATIGAGPAGNSAHASLRGFQEGDMSCARDHVGESSDRPDMAFDPRAVQRVTPHQPSRPAEHRKIDELDLAHTMAVRWSAATAPRPGPSDQRHPTR